MFTFYHVFLSAYKYSRLIDCRFKLKFFILTYIEIVVLAFQMILYKCFMLF